MSQTKPGIALRIPVLMLDNTGTGVAGITFSNVTAATIIWQDATVSDVTPNNAQHWVEITTGAFANVPGHYILLIDKGRIPSSYGQWFGAVWSASTVSRARFSWGDIVQYIETDTVNKIDALAATLPAPVIPEDPNTKWLREQGRRT